MKALGLIVLMAACISCAQLQQQFEDVVGCYTETEIRFQYGYNPGDSSFDGRFTSINDESHGNPKNHGSESWSFGGDSYAKHELEWDTTLHFGPAACNK